MKVLVADKYPDDGLAALREIGCEVSYEPDARDDALRQLLLESPIDVVVVRSTKVTGPMLEASSLSLVVRAGAGYNTIDVKTASALGIYVSNCPGKNSVAVAELAIGLMLALDRRIADNVADLRQGLWNKKEYSKARGVLGRTLGLVGVGNIGTEVAARARALGMNVVAWSRSLTDERAAALGVERKATIEQVAAACDVLSVHLALNDQTRGLVGATVFSAMRPGATFINTSRAEVVDEEALAKAIGDKGIRAGLDVFSGEPTVAAGPFDHPLAKSPSVYGTHHIGASTEQAQLAVADEVIRIIAHFKATGEALHCVNMAQPIANPMLIVQTNNQPGGLPHVFSILDAAGVTAVEMDQTVSDSGKAACAHIRLDKQPNDATLEKLRGGHPTITGVDLIPVA